MAPSAKKKNKQPQAQASVATVADQPVSNSNSVVVCSSLALVMWLVLGLIARGSEESQASDNVKMLVSIALFTQVLACFIGLGILGFRRPRRGAQIFAAAMLGFGISTSTVVSSGATGTGVVFWTLAGVHIGWLLEVVARPVASFGEYLNKVVPPGTRQPQLQGRRTASDLR